MTTRTVIAKPHIDSNTGEELIMSAVSEMTFPAGIPGFPSARNFQVSPFGDDLSPFVELLSLDTPGLRFIATDPGSFFPDFDVTVPEDAAELIGLEEGEQPVTLVFITLTEPTSASTANLLGPVVVNPRNRFAVQVVLDSGVSQARVPLAG